MPYPYTAVNKNNLFKTFSLLLMLTVAFAFSSITYAFEGYAIISLNPDFKTLSKGKARMLYRGKIKTLQGQIIELSDWPSENEVRTTFYQELLGKDLAQMNAHWAGLSFSGKARVPKEIDNANLESLLQWLSEKDSRIGYAPLANLPKHVNVLYVVEKEKQQ
ncbi:hypothetical protein GCM10017161_14590 [Thalassotalea marina]|uniref:Uncharacterized protein n=2 Tax=Thalassotalea marina TaxID=1673741 RepID=A0A919BHC3_9GAMM|nr:hypothetical protein GCM10017161_14590 [Thalassotalea marina]